MNTATLTIVIVTWNSARDIVPCLQSIFASTIAGQLHVVVVDNASSDATETLVKEKFPSVEFIHSGGNLGFSRANNIALKALKTPYAMLLNPDTIVEPSALETLLKTLQNDKSISLIGPRLLLPSGRIQPESARGIPELVDYFYLYSLLTMVGTMLFGGKVFSRAYLNSVDRTKAQSVPAISGAAMMFSAESFQRVGLLDEQFFFGGEDLDYCIRFGKIGKVYYAANAIIHHHQGSSMRQSFGRAALETYFSDERHYRKYHPSSGWAFRLIARVTYVPRLVMLSVIEMVRGKFSWKVFTSALKNFQYILTWTSPIHP